jgi:hypothetical protein
MGWVEVGCYHYTCWHPSMEVTLAAASTTDRGRATETRARWGCAEGEDASVGVVSWRRHCTTQLQTTTW